MAARKPFAILLLIIIITSTYNTAGASPARHRYGTRLVMAYKADSTGGAPSTRHLMLSNPYWDFVLDAAGYSDEIWWYPSPRHPHTKHEMLSGEWGAAIYYDGISTEPNAMWLTDQFIYPDWYTNSDFEILEDPNAWNDPCNPVDDVDTGYSAVRNGQVEVRIEYEMVDLGEQDVNTGEGCSPLAFRDGNGMPVCVYSERYIVLQTYTVTNVEQNDINNLEFYQLLAGLYANHSVYETRFLSDRLENYTPYNPAHKVGNFHYDITQWNDPCVGSLDHRDWIGFAVTGMPDAFENGFYRLAGPGTHHSIEERNLNGDPDSDGDAGAMGWYLGTLEPNESVSITMAIMLGAGPIQSGPLELSKVDDVNDGDCVKPGDQITYTIDYNYPAEANWPDINDVDIIDYLPAEVSYVSSEPCGIYDSNSHTIRWEVGTLEPNDFGSVALKVKLWCAEPDSDITNSCEIRSNDQVSQNAYEVTPVCCCPTLTKVDDVNVGECVGPTDEITYTVCYAANGYGDTNVVVIDSLPNEVKFLSAPGGNYDPCSHTVTWYIGTLGPNDSNCLTLIVDVQCPGPDATITNYCEMSGDCMHDINSFEYTSVCSLPTLTNDDDVGDGNCVGPTDSITYSICYAANGYGDTNVVIVDSLPNDVDYYSSVPAGAYNPGTHKITWEIGTLDPDDSDCITLTVKVKCPQPSGTITNYCEMSGDCIYDIDSFEYTSVCSAPTLTKDDDVDGGGCILRDDYIDYSICYAANGYGDTNVVIIDSLSNDVNYYSSTPAGDYNAASHTVTWNIGTLGSDDSNCIVLTVEVGPVEPQSAITNQCQMIGDCIYGITADENTPVCPNYPTLEKFDDVDEGECVPRDDYITYSICYAGNAYGDTNVVIIDSLPNDVNYVWSDPCGLYDSNSHTVTWYIGTLGPKDSNCITLAAEVKAALGSVITNCTEMNGDHIHDVNAFESSRVCWPGGCTIYIDIDASGANEGASWQDAFTSLQDGMDKAQVLISGPSSCADTQLWVAAGTYRPDEGVGVEPNDRAATFGLISNVAIYGGFPPGGGPWEARDASDANNDTVLSGDLEGNDRQGVEPGDLHSDPCRADNSYHVVTGSDTDETAVLDGFIISGGNAGVSDGGGMYNYAGSPTVTNCRFSENATYDTEGEGFGGGMYNYWGSPIVTNCTFSGNAASDGGAAMYNDYSNSTIINCTFIGNDGGGMENNGGNSTVTNCTFAGNLGCGMSNDDCNSMITSCAFSENVSGGMRNDFSSSIVTNCRFRGNSAYYGGGIYDEGGGLTVTNCTFSGNSASEGGGMYNADGSPAITSCTFVGNEADDGGAMYNWTADATIINCIFWDNRAIYDGNEVFNYYADPNFSYCDITGCKDAYGLWDANLGLDGGGNINAEPCFAAPGYWDANGTPGDTDDDFWVEGNHRLLSGSPCIDAGDNNSVPYDYADLDGDSNTVEPTPLDLDNFPRFIDGDCNDSVVVDIGAYEFLRSDINHSGSVDFTDFGLFALRWLETDCDQCWGAELTCDGQVEWADLYELMNWWLAGSP